MKEIIEKDLIDWEEYIIEYENWVRYIWIACFIWDYFNWWMINITHEFWNYECKKWEWKIVKIYIK